MSDVIGWEVVSRDRLGKVDNTWDSEIYLTREGADRSAEDANASQYGAEAGVAWFVVELRVAVPAPGQEG